MIDWIKSWFGRGRVRAEWEGIDRLGHARSGDAKVPYVGVYDESALKDHIAQNLLYQHGITVTKMQVIAHIEE